MADAPQFRTTPYQATAARFVNDGRGMAAIGTALSSFFDAGAKTAETVAQIQHREEMVQIKRENEALAKQGIADQKLGKPIDPANAERRDYFEAYQTSAADAQAHQLSEGLREHLAAQPLDGSVDLAQVAQDYYRKEVGTGTGDPTYDARMLSQFSRAAEAQVSQFAEARRDTVRQNTAEAIRSEASRLIMSPEGIKAPQLAEVADRLLSVVHGNVANRDKLLLSIVDGAVQNDAQGEGVLTALQELGYDTREPEFFKQASAVILQRANQVKTFEAGQEVQRWQQDLIGEKAKHPDGILPPEMVAEFADRAFSIDSVHGTGDGPFHAIYSELLRSTQRKAAASYFKDALTNKFGTRDGAAVAIAHGKPPSAVLTDGFELGLAEVVAETAKTMPLLKELADSRNDLGLLDPMKSDGAAGGLAVLQLTSGYRSASMDTMPESLKNKMGMPLVGRDPALALRSFKYYKALKEGGFTREQLHRYFPNDAAENRFNALWSLSQGSMDTRQLIQHLIDQPYEAAAYADAFKTGKVNLASVAQRFGAGGRPEEIEKAIVKSRRDAILNTEGRKSWFKSHSISMDSNEEAAHDSRMLEQFHMQRVSSGTVDIEQAAANATQTGRYILVPGLHDNLQAVRDPFEGRGRHIRQPLNEAADHPFSTSKGFAPIYAPGVQIKNAKGDDEDTLVTWAEDAKEAHRLFPGMIAEHDDLWLQRPNAAGLSQVKTSNGRPIVFRPGQPIALRVGPGSMFSDLKGLASTQVPRDPYEAQMFFRARLPPGWFAVAESGNYVMYYGSRVKYGEKEMQQRIAHGSEQLRESRKADIAATGTYDLESGAAMRFTHPTGSRTAAQGSRSDTTHTGPSWGDVGGAIAGAGRSAVGLVVNAGGTVADGASYVWKGVGGPGRVQRFKDAFTSENEQ